ncbi:hypothetical protein HN011_008629 [Eciton burchellii]|nr:hypothetical protein HN011_008629 [Eciton burchellii]
MRTASSAWNALISMRTNPHDDEKRFFVPRAGTRFAEYRSAPGKKRNAEDARTRSAHRIRLACLTGLTRSVAGSARKLKKSGPEETEAQSEVSAGTSRNANRECARDEDVPPIVAIGIAALHFRCLLRYATTTSERIRQRRR